MADPINTTVTKTGLHLAFYEKPYRAYTVNGEFSHPWTEAEPWGRVPSVTAILGVLDKSGPLVGWATNLTCEGLWKLVQTKDEHGRRYRIPQDVTKDGVVTWQGWRRMQKDLKDRGWDHRSATSEAQIRGTTIHSIGEDWVTHGKFPKPADYPEEWRGYVRAISAFLAKHGDELAMAEQIVGSAIHGYAGTCDTVSIAKVGDHRERLDYKTSKQTYARTHFRQLGAYELAAVEGGEEPTDRQGIVILRPDGTYEVSYADEVEWRGSPAESFLRVLDVWRDEQPLKKHEDATYKARTARERAAKV